MKQTLIALLLTALLLMTAACGDSMSGEDKARTDNPRIGDVDSALEQGRDAAKRGESDLRRAANDAARDVEETLDGSGWEEMLRNGRVRDTDGDLTDGENALHGRYGTAH